MARDDFRVLAARAAELRGDMDNIPVIEKEIVHYEILRSLYEHGRFESLTFQEGTCLRLCYGSSRYSEDLDFTCVDIDALDADAVCRELERDLLRGFDVAIRVKKPATKRFERIKMKRWLIVVDTAPARADLPSQKIKIEVASVPSYTKELRRLKMNYGELPETYGFIVVPCQTVTEIAADKIISFANTDGYVRHRDIWDLQWIMNSPDFDSGALSEMVAAKHGDYGCERPLGELLQRGRSLAEATVRSDGFVTQMKRFLPSLEYQRAIGLQCFLETIGNDVADLYAKVSH